MNSAGGDKFGQEIRLDPSRYLGPRNFDLDAHAALKQDKLNIPTVEMADVDGATRSFRCGLEEIALTHSCSRRSLSTPTPSHT